MGTGGHSSTRIAGKIHGGNQPVSGAVVTLYSASQGTFAAGATAIANTTSAADGYGSFAFQASSTSTNNNSDNSYFCDPGGSNPFYYLVARGGTTVNTPDAQPNPDSVFIAPLGRCQEISASTFVNMSEVVTVATMAALHQFMNPSASGGIETSVGSDGIFASDQNLGNALYSVGNMVNLSTGLANTAVTKEGVGVTVTVTPEAAKINQLANALSACFNYSGSGNPNCSTLFSNAAPPSDTSYTSVPKATMATATDPLVALYYIFTNPTNATTTGGDGTTNRTNLFNLSGGAGAPYQPTLASVPTDWTIGVAFTSASTCPGPDSASPSFLDNPSSLSIDRYGNVFFSNMQAGIASLASLTGIGLPGSCTTLTSTGEAPGSMVSVIDSADNVYAAVSGTTDAYAYNLVTESQVHFSTPEPVLGLTADGNGHVFFSTVGGRLYDAVPATLSYTVISSDLDSQGGATSLQVDPLGRIWASGTAATVTVPDKSSTTGYSTSKTSNVLPLPLISLTLGRDNGDFIYRYATDGVGLEISRFSDAPIGAGQVAEPISSTPHFGDGLVSPVSVAVDGSQNVWVANSSGSITGFSLSGLALAPSGFVKDPSYFGSEKAISIDAAGNIWVASGQNTITEVVGAAVPVVKSYATGLKTGRFQQIP